MRLILLAALTLAWAAQAADDAAGAVAALAVLTDPRRLNALSAEAFPAQLGPALAWLQAARARDISPEAVIARAVRLNGLDPAAAERTRDSLLRALAKADAWALFGSFESSQALARGQSARIAEGMHKGHLARAEAAPAVGAVAPARDFGDLALRADDEPPLAPKIQRPLAASSRRAVRRKSGDAPLPPAGPLTYDDQLPKP